jgi:hypothetical protein
MKDNLKLFQQVLNLFPIFLTNMAKSIIKTKKRSKIKDIYKINQVDH